MNHICDVNLDLRSALFLDFDGTLVEIADDRDQVFLDQQTSKDLVLLSAILSGAMAIISGRDIDDLARRVPSDLLRLGNHGAYRLEIGQIAGNFTPLLRQKTIEEITARGNAMGAEVEVKKTSIALHYRSRPHLQSDCIALLAEFAGSTSGLVLQTGKMVAELKMAGLDKGSAIKNCMAASPFIGRHAVFIGDDTTDEDGFEAVTQLGGTAIKIGPPPTGATVFAESPAQVREWLTSQTKGLVT
jgi:trehalose 6-phosphate phosphatase